MKRVQMVETCGEGALLRRKDSAFSRDPSAENRVVNLYPDARFQTLLGFGGAFTDSAASNYARMSKDARQEIMRALFDADTGLGYRFCRTHIGSCDFSLREYAYVEENDRSLASFDLGHDREFVLPMVKDALRYTGNELSLFASPWSPPGWMKTNGDVRFGGQVKDEYKDTWARYVAKYLLAYRAEGINIGAITVQNEPIAKQTWESCYYSPEDEAAMIRDHLAPALDEFGLQDIKIIIWDHNKERVYDRARDVLRDPAVNARVWGIGFHWYSGAHFAGVALVSRAFPEKQLIETEFCTGLSRKGGAGWDAYASEIMGNLNAGMTASTDWNLLLDMEGGPYHYRDSGCDAVILANPKTDKIEYRAAYHQTAHFSRFIRPGAARIGSTSFSRDLELTAFENADGSIAAVLIHRGSAPCAFYLRMGDETAPITMEAQSIATLMIR